MLNMYKFKKMTSLFVLLSIIFTTLLLLSMISCQSSDSTNDKTDNYFKYSAFAYSEVSTKTKNTIEEGKELTKTISFLGEEYEVNYYKTRAINYETVDLYKSNDNTVSCEFWSDTGNIKYLNVDITDSNVFSDLECESDYVEWTKSFFESVGDPIPDDYLYSCTTHIDTVKENGVISSLDSKNYFVYPSSLNENQNIKGWQISYRKYLMGMQTDNYYSISFSDNWISVFFDKKDFRNMQAEDLGDIGKVMKALDEKACKIFEKQENKSYQIRDCVLHFWDNKVCYSFHLILLDNSVILENDPRSNMYLETVYVFVDSIK